MKPRAVRPPSSRVSSRESVPFSFSFRGRPGLVPAPPAFSVSPLVQGVVPENLRFPAHGGLSVALWDQWPAMLADLRLLERVLVVTGNPFAVIGHYRSYPGLAYFQEGDCFAHGAGLAVDLGKWTHAAATELREGDRARYAVEFFDHGNEPIHKICLTPDSDLDAFLEWVATHQAAGLPPAPPAPAAPGFPPGKSAGRRKALLPLLHRLMELEMPIRVAVGNAAASQSHAFTFREMREAGAWIFCAGDDAGWHFAPSRIHRLRRETCACCGGDWLRALEPGGTTSFLLTPAPETDLTLWNGLASRACQSDL